MAGVAPWVWILEAFLRARLHLGTRMPSWCVRATAGRPCRQRTGACLQTQRGAALGSSRDVENLPASLRPWRSRMHAMRSIPPQDAVRGGSQPGEQLVSPSGITAMPDGGFMVADTNASRILCFNASGALQYLFTTAEPGARREAGARSGAAPAPCAVLAAAFLRAFGVVNCLATSCACTQPSPRTPLPAPESSPVPVHPAGGKLLQPIGLALDDTGAGRLYVISSNSPTVQVGTGWSSREGPRSRGACMGSAARQGGGHTSVGEEGVRGWRAAACPQPLCTPNACSRLI